MYRSSLRGTKHMIMRNRNEWLAWAATAVGSLGLVGLATAQPDQQHALDLAAAAGTTTDDLMPDLGTSAMEIRTDRSALISDDGWSTEVPISRQVVVVRNRVDEVLRIDLFNERGEVLEHLVWNDQEGWLKPLAVEALVAGRYAVRVTGTDRSQVIRFRKD